MSDCKSRSTRWEGLCEALCRLLKNMVDPLLILCFCLKLVYSKNISTVKDESSFRVWIHQSLTLNFSTRHTFKKATSNRKVEGSGFAVRFWETCLPYFAVITLRWLGLAHTHIHVSNKYPQGQCSRSKLWSVLIGNQTRISTRTQDSNGTFV